jgi:addiction module HigA family antidote
LENEQRSPNPHPGDLIREDFLKPWGMTPYRLARSTGLSTTAVHEILKGKRAVTAPTALRLSAFLGCSPRYWLGLQAAYDLEEAQRNPTLAEELAQISRYQHAGPLVDDEEGDAEKAAA